MPFTSAARIGQAQTAAADRPRFTASAPPRAPATTPEAVQRVRLTASQSTGHKLKTLLYAPPEQYVPHGVEQPSVLVDVFSTAATLAELLLGQPVVGMAQADWFAPDTGSLLFGAYERKWSRVSRKGDSEILDDFSRLPFRALVHPDAEQRVIPVDLEDLWRDVWEYAARAGGDGPYGLGEREEVVTENNLERFAWLNTNSGGTIHAVKTRQPNAWGLHDLWGNVWEWVADGYSEKSWAALSASGTLSLLPGGARLVTDPGLVNTIGDKSGNTPPASRVLRGGSAWDVPRWLRSGNRSWSEPAYTYVVLGFRCVLAPAPQPLNVVP